MTARKLKAKERKPRPRKRKAAEPRTVEQMVAEVDALHLKIADVLGEMPDDRFVSTTLTLASDMLMYAVLSPCPKAELHRLLSVVPARERLLVGDRALAATVEDVDAEDRPFVESLLRSRLDVVDSAFVALHRNLMVLDNDAFDSAPPEATCPDCGGAVCPSCGGC